MSDIPAGSYPCSLHVDDDGICRIPIENDSQGILSIKLKIWLYADDQAESPFDSVEKFECIDATAPARGATETTPYDFMSLALRNLGAESEAAVDDAVILGIESEDQMVVFPGSPKLAMAKIQYKAGQRGGSFQNVSIMPYLKVTDEAKTKAAEAIRARRAKNAPQPSPFATPPARGQAQRPPAKRPPV